MRRIAILPTLLTLGNGICGYVAITYASKVLPTPRPEDDHSFTMAGWFILFAMVFDMLDGYVARLSRTASKFGGELDSLCDVISFGVAPAFIALKLGPGWEPSVFLHQLLAGITALYLACTALRLARFNVDNNPDPAFHKRFRGLPSPAAAGCIASLSICRGEFPAKLVQFVGEAHLTLESARQSVNSFVTIAAPLGALVVALLMVSNVAYPHATSRLFRGRGHVLYLVQMLLGGMILLMFREIAPALVFWVYALVFPVRSLLAKGLNPDAPPRLDESVSQ